MPVLYWNVGRHFVVLAVMMLVLASDGKPSLTDRIKNRFTRGHQAA